MCTSSCNLRSPGSGSSARAYPLTVFGFRLTAAWQSDATRNHSRRLWSASAGRVSSELSVHGHPCVCVNACMPGGWWLVVAFCRCCCLGGRAGRSLTQCAIRVKDRLFREKIDGFSVRFYRGGESSSFKILVSHHLCAEWWQWCIWEAGALTFSFSAFSLPIRSFTLTGELGEAGSVALGVLALILRCFFLWPLPL